MVAGLTTRRSSDQETGSGKEIPERRSHELGCIDRHDMPGLQDQEFGPRDPGGDACDMFGRARRILASGDDQRGAAYRRQIGVEIEPGQHPPGRGEPGWIGRETQLLIARARLSRLVGEGPADAEALDRRDPLLGPGSLRFVQHRRWREQGERGDRLRVARSEGGRHCCADGGADNCDRPGDGERGEQGSEIVGHVAADTLFGQKYSAFFDAEWKRSSGQ